MPELPEMETYKNLLSPLIIGKEITSTQVTREKSINVSIDQWNEVVLGNNITAISRRAKHILFHLENHQNLLMHLMLGGWMFWGNEGDKPERTVQVQLSFGEQQLYFIGLRLGYLHLYSDEELELKLPKLGPEPMDSSFSEAMFTERLHKRRGVLKPVMVDQSFLSGVGNCYSDEICYVAALRPDRKIETFMEKEVAALYRATRSVLHEAVTYGGYMDHPLFTGDKQTGGYNERCQVYDREGEPCLRCKEGIVRVEVSGRKSFYCPGCQH
ncbi:MAG: Fpg/Nei family DNA glycosylase [Gorillibacterium sp.]|nr:Fpg/Nei family DNA glycosylase [Gorillibacterium sp.]